MTALNPHATGRDELTDAQYQIATAEGLRAVRGQVYQTMGLHRDGRCVVLTHLPTGSRLGAFDDLRDAYAAMAEACRGFGRA